MAKTRSGKVSCAVCQYTWTVTIEDPGFDPTFKCPECDSMSGAFIIDVVKEDKRLHCFMCGRVIKREGVCPKCNLTR